MSERYEPGREAAAALAAMPIEIRATMAAEYVWLMRSAERAERVSPTQAERLRVLAADLLIPPLPEPPRHCAECDAVVPAQAAGVTYRNAVLDVDVVICRPCVRQAKQIAAEDDRAGFLFPQHAFSVVHSHPISG